MQTKEARQVLILVVVDDGLVHFANFKSNSQSSNVLILIVMEDGLVRCRNSKRTRAFYVLILVVMEDGLLLCFFACGQVRGMVS